MKRPPYGSQDSDTFSQLLDWYFNEADSMCGLISVQGQQFDVLAGVAHAKQTERGSLVGDFPTDWDDHGKRGHRSGPWDQENVSGWPKGGAESGASKMRRVRRAVMTQSWATQQQLARYYEMRRYTADVSESVLVEAHKAIRAELAAK